MQLCELLKIGDVILKNVQENVLIRLVKDTNIALIKLPGEKEMLIDKNSDIVKETITSGYVFSIN